MDARCGIQDYLGESRKSDFFFVKIGKCGALCGNIFDSEHLNIVLAQLERWQSG
jgi:hypothetical protein